MLIDSDTATVLIRDPKHAITGAKGSSTHKQSHDDKDKNKPRGRRQCRADREQNGRGTAKHPQTRLLAVTLGGGRGAARQLGARFASEQAANHGAPEQLIFTPHTRASAAGRLRAAVRLSPLKAGESPRGSYAIVAKSSNCRDNATGVTHASTESCGVRLEITHIHIYRACLRFNPFQHGAKSHRPFPMLFSPHAPPPFKKQQPPPRSMHAPGLLHGNHLLSA